MILANSENKLSQFRDSLYNEHLNNRNDTQMNLPDALCTNDLPRSVVKLSLNPCFQRDYNSLYKAITENDTEQALVSLAGTGGTASAPSLERQILAPVHGYYGLSPSLCL
jgi:hypothetical protein